MTLEVVVAALAVSGVGVVVAIGWGMIDARRPRKPRGLVDPVGWDERLQRTHDVTMQADGALLHHSTCWCRPGTAGAWRPS